MATKPPEDVSYSFFALFRVFFGICLALSTLEDFISGYWKAVFLEPKLHFHYQGFSWVHPLPEFPLALCYAALTLSSLLFAAGIFWRVTAIVNFVLYSYTVLLDKALYNNHYYLIALLCLLFCLLPVGNPKGGQAPRGPGWFLDLFRYQFVLVYFFAGVAKWNRDWLLGEPFGIWLLPKAEHYNALWLVNPYVVSLLALSGLLLDLLVGPALLHQKARYPAMLALVTFHCCNETLFDIGVFPAMMVASCLLFLGDPPVSRKLWKGRLATLALVYLVIQCLLPWRHLLIPGLCAWTDDGHRYSWRMKLRSKKPRLKSLIVDGRQKDPYQYLTPRQVRYLGSRPDMIVEFVDYLVREEGAKSVRMLITARLNGRPEQTFVDPRTELTEVEFSAFSRTTWLARLENPYLSRNPKYSFRVALGFLYAASTVQLVWSLFLAWKSRDWRALGPRVAGNLLLMVAAYQLFQGSRTLLLMASGMATLGLARLAWTEEGSWGFRACVLWQGVVLSLLISIAYLYPWV